MEERWFSETILSTSRAELFQAMSLLSPDSVPMNLTIGLSPYTMRRLKSGEVKGPA